MKNYLTYRTLDTLALRAANIDRTAIDPRIRQHYVNTVLFSTWKGLEADPFYNAFVTLAAASDTEILAAGTGTVPGTSVIYNGSFVVTALSATSITRSSGTFQTGSLLSVTSFRNLAGVVGVGNFVARVVQGGATATIEIISGVYATVYNPATDGLVVNVLKSPAALTASLSGFYFDKILSVRDNVSRPSMAVFDSVQDPAAFHDLTRTPSMAKRVAWRQVGETLEFFVGADATAIGTVTAEVRLKIAPYTDSNEDEPILLPPELNGAVIAAVAGSYREHTSGTPKEKPDAKG